MGSNNSKVDVESDYEKRIHKLEEQNVLLKSELEELKKFISSRETENVAFKNDFISKEAVHLKLTRNQASRIKVY